MQEFSQTRNGQKFLSDVGRIADALQKLAVALDNGDAVIAERMVTLHANPTDDPDEANVQFESLALKLAQSVLKRKK